VDGYCCLVNTRSHADVPSLLMLLLLLVVVMVGAEFYLRGP
jgi:hypothetical protein